MRMQVLIHTLKTCFWKQISHELFFVVRISIICKALKSNNHLTILMIAFCGIFAAKCKNYFRQNIRLYSNLRHLCHTDIIFVHGDTLPFSPRPPFLSPYLFHNWKCFARLNVRKMCMKARYVFSITRKYMISHWRLKENMSSNNTLYYGDKNMPWFHTLYCSGLPTTVLPIYRSSHTDWPMLIRRNNLIRMTVVIVILLSFALFSIFT